MIGDRTSPASVVTLLVVDAALLAMMELFFLTLAVGTVPIPVSPLVALLTTPWLVRQAGQLGGPWAAAAPLVVWLLVVAVLGLAGPGGDVLLVGDWSALALVVCGLVPAAFVLGRVLRRARDSRTGAARPPGGGSPPGPAGHGDAVLTESTSDGRGEDPAWRGSEPESSRRHG